VYDKRTVFVDRLVLPRMIVPLDDDSILTNETPRTTWSSTPTRTATASPTGASTSTPGSGSGADGNLEHEQAGFVWGLDNWIYSTYNAFRFRWTPRTAS
jgi:hypothetical protein